MYDYDEILVAYEKHRISASLLVPRSTKVRNESLAICFVHVSNPAGMKLHLTVDMALIMRGFCLG